MGNYTSQVAVYSVKMWVLMPQIKQPTIKQTNKTTTTTTTNNQANKQNNKQTNKTPKKPKSKEIKQNKEIGRYLTNQDE